MNQYIITEEQLSYLANTGSCYDEEIEEKVRSTPYNPQAEREKALDDVKRIIEQGNDALDELQVDGYSTITITAKRDVLGWLFEKLQELREGKDGGRE